MDILQTCTEVVVMMTSDMGSQHVLGLGAVLCDVVCSEFSRMSSTGLTEPNCTRFHAVWHPIKPTSPPFLIWCRLAGCCSLTALCCKTTANRPQQEISSFLVYLLYSVQIVKQLLSAYERINSFLTLCFLHSVPDRPTPASLWPSSCLRS